MVATASGIVLLVVAALALRPYLIYLVVLAVIAMLFDHVFRS